MDFSFDLPFDPENLPEDMPEEVKATIRAQHAAHQHHQMLSDQTAHDVVAFIKRLDEHDLMLLRGLVNALAMGTETTHGYYFGLMSVELEKFGICLACGKKHDEQLKELLGDAEESIAENIAKISPATQLQDGTPDCVVCGRDNDHGTHEALEIGSHLSHRYWPPDKIFANVKADKVNYSEQGWANFMTAMEAEDIVIMDNYGVQLIPQSFPKVACGRCGKEYVTLQDRILRKPGIDGCDGCQQKEAWG